MSSPSDEGADPLGAVHSLVARGAVPVDERVEQAERALPCGLRVFHRRVVEKRLHSRYSLAQSSLTGAGTMDAFYARIFP